jgi:hypothetical protein
MEKNEILIESLFSFIAKSCECFQSFGVYRSMNAKSVTEILQRVAKEKEA